MTARVVMLPTIPEVTQIVTGRAVRAPTYRDLAHLNNWLMGRGGQLIPATYCGDTLTAGTAYEFQFRVRPRYPATSRLWTIYARSASTTRTSTLAVEIPSGGTSRSYQVRGVRYLESGRPTHAQPIRYVHRAAGRSAAEATATIKLTPSVENCIIESIACVEIPRDRLNTTDADYGQDAEQCVVEAPIWGSFNDGLQDMLRNFDGSEDIGARNGFFQWAVPYTAGGSETTTFAPSISGTSGSLFPLSPIILARATTLDNATTAAATTAAVSFRVLCKVTSGVTGTVTVTMTSGDSTTVSSINSTSWTWWPSTASAAATVDVDTTDMTAADGRRSTRWDEAAWTFSASGEGSLWVAAVSMFEAAP